MDKIKITGGNELNGVIPISGAKNAALPLMIASMLTKETLTLDNMPLLADVIQLERILSNHGVDYTIAGKRAGATGDEGRTVHFTAREIVDTTAPYELVSRMRASFWVLAPAAGAHGRGAGVAARRLRHRHAAGRSAADGDGEARRQDQHRERLCRRHPPRTDCAARKSISPRSRSAARIWR